MAYLRSSVLASTLIASALGSAVACGTNSATPPSASPQDGGNTGEAGVDGGNNTTDDPELMFRGFQQELVMKCGGVNGVCHKMGTFMNAPRWLGDPDPYKSAREYPGIIPASNDPGDSKLLTQVEHEGPTLVSSPLLFDKVRDWIVAEVKANGPRLPSTAPMTVTDGFNTLDLSPLVGGLAGAKLTFTASSGNGILTVLNMKITAPFPKGLHVENPFFVIVPAKGPVITDTVDGFPGSLDVPQGQTVDFYGGSAVLLKWDPAGKLKIVFSKLEATGALDAGALGCKALQSFTANAAPLLKGDLSPDGGAGTSGTSCFGCHGGGNGAAQFAMDLAKLGTDDAVACAQVLNRIKPGDAPNSQILLTPTGDPMGDINHADAGGPASACATTPIPPCVPDGFIPGMTVWINAEK